MSARRGPGWSQTAIWWQVYPLGFLGAEPELVDGQQVQHRLPALIDWLDYLVELGCNGLALNPIVTSQSHGYDVVDPFTVDPRLGDDADVDRLIAACHDKGIRVLFDGVFNHVGRAFPRFTDVLARGRASDSVEWFDIDWDAKGSAGFGYRTFEGHGGLVALNHNCPEVADYVVAVMEHWLSRGVDGWRLDAAYAVPLPFWRTVTDRVRQHHPDAWFVGEVIHGEFADWVTKGGLDSVTQYELWKAIWSSLNDRNFFELSWTVQRHLGFCETFVPLTFLGNHDVTRIASALTDDRDLGPALVLLFTLPGIPAVYYGDEQAFRGIKEERVGGDDAIRPAFPAGPDDLAPDGWPVYRLHQELIGLRRREPWLTMARVEVLTLANEQFAYRAFADDGQSLVVLVNISEEPFTLKLEGSAEMVLTGAGETRLAADSARMTGGDLVVEAHGWAVVRPQE